MAQKTTVLDKLNLVDRFLFDETMEYKDAYQAVLSILLENEVELLEKIQTEKELRISPELRSIRLDVVSMDKDWKIYYTEMQKKDTGNLVKRSRYYQAQMDVSLLEPGSIDFNKMNDTCFILVAPFDIFGRGLYRYTFEGVCKECPDLKLNDGAIRIFINTRGTNRGDFSQEFLDFMEYITISTDEVAQRTESARIKLIHRRVCEIKASEKMGGKYMQKWEEIALARQEGKEEGQEQGIEQGKKVGLVQGIKIFIRDKLSDQIAEDKIVSKLQQYFSLSEDEAEEYVKRIQQDIQKEMEVV